MKTQSLLWSFALICLGCIASQAQEYEYVPLVREGVEWTYLDENGLKLEYSFYRYRLEGDTIIDNKAYQKCYRYDICQFDETAVLSGWLREQDKKVYLLLNPDTWGIELDGEKVVYDFTPEKAGDEMQWFDQTVTVTKVDSVVIDGKKRKRIKYDEWFIVIEGLGCLGYGDLLAPYTDVSTCSDCFRSFLNSVRRDDGVYEYKDKDFRDHSDFKDPCREGEYEYVPFVREGVEWGYYQYNPVHPEDNGIIRLQFEGDTLLDGKTYKKLYMYKGCDLTPDNGTLIDFMREENKIVYSKKDRKYSDEIYVEDAETEVVLYDFSLDVGDSLWVPSYYEYQKVTRIDTVKVGNTYRKQFYIGNPTYPLWTEGLGVLENNFLFCPFCLISTCLDCDRRSLTFVIENGEEVYGTDEECRMGSISDNKADALRIARTPDALIVTLPGNGYHLAELIDTTGRLVWCEYLDGEPGEVSVPTTALAPGVYVVALTDNRGKRTVQKVGWQ